MLLVIVVKWTQRCNCKQKQHNKGVREKSEEKQEGNWKQLGQETHWWRGQRWERCKEPIRRRWWRRRRRWGGRWRRRRRWRWWRATGWRWWSRLSGWRTSAVRGSPASSDTEAAPRSPNQFSRMAGSTSSFLSRLRNSEKM